MLTAERLPRSGKVRDLYDLPDRRLVLVASDRISAFDVVLPTPIPDKGRVLTGLSRFWFDETRSIIPNHLLATDVQAVVDGYAALLEAHGQDPRAVIPEDGFDAWRGRVMVCQPANVVPIEAVVRGYLSGSGWREYQAQGTVCGIALPAGLRESDRLPEPIFAPASKAPPGQHDENLSFDAAIDYAARNFNRGSVFGRAPAPDNLDIEVPALPRDLAAEILEAIRDASLVLYRYGAAVAAKAGIILADTKFEFGFPVTVHLDSPGPPEEHLRESDQLPQPIFTPASKAPPGQHDENLSFDAAIDYVARNFNRGFVFGRAPAPDDVDIEVPVLPRDLAAEILEAIRDASLVLYHYGAAVAAKAGIILADTKFEFGFPVTVHLDSPGPPEEHLRECRTPSMSFSLAPGTARERLTLIDEVLTPDSSRLWDATSYAPGGSQASFDKQFVRDWLQTQAWNKMAPGPELPRDVVEGTRARYVEAFERMTGASFQRYLEEDVIAT